MRPEKLFVKYLSGVNSRGPVIPRRYTLTHSDVTGDLYLSVGADYDIESISGFYTRLMRDEVLAEWCKNENGFSLHVYCHVTGGIVFGRAGWRLSIFRREMPLVLEAIRDATDADVEVLLSGLQEVRHGPFDALDLEIGVAPFFGDSRPQDLIVGVEGKGSQLLC